MCDPVTIGGIALTGLSTAINSAAQSKVQGARDDALAAERSRQQGLDREAAAVNDQTRDVYKNTDKKETKRGKQLGEYFTDQKAEVPTEAQLPTSASNVTVQEEAKQRGQAQDFTDRTGNALGELRAFGDLMGDNALTQARGASQIGQLAGFKNGSQNVLSYELDDANHAGDNMKLFGDLIGGFGGLAVQKGLTAPGISVGSGGVVRSGVGGAAVAPGAATNSMAIGRLYDRRSVPGYANIG